MTDDRAKRASIYIGDPLARALDALGEDYAANRSGRINTIAERYMAMIADELSRPPLGDLTRDEWRAILDANNGVELGTGPAMPALVWANVHDARGLADKWGVDQAGLVKRLQAAPKSALIAILEVADRFWSRSEKETDAALAAAGVTQ